MKTSMYLLKMMHSHFPYGNNSAERNEVHLIFINKYNQHTQLWMLVTYTWMYFPASMFDYLPGEKNILRYFLLFSLKK